MVAIVRMVDLARVPLRLQRLDMRPDQQRLLDGVGAGRGEAGGGVLRVALDMHAEPDQPNFRAHQPGFERFWHEGAIRAVAALEAGERAVAGAFLLHHRLEMDRRAQREARLAHRVEGEQGARQPRLHVARAAPIHPFALDPGLERRPLPARRIAGRHNVDMAVEDQRPALAQARTPCAHDVEGVLIGRVDHGREAGQILDVGDLDLPVIDGKAAPGHCVGHQILNRMFLPAHGGATHHLLREAHLPVEIGVHGGQDRRARGRIDGRADGGNAHDVSFRTCGARRLRANAAAASPTPWAGTGR